MTPSQVDQQGTAVTLENYLVLGILKGSRVPESALKVEFHITPDFAKYGDLDVYYSNSIKNSQDPNNPIPASLLPSVKHETVNGVPAICWAGPIEGIHTVLGKGKWLYVVTAYPKNSRYGSIFDEIVSTLQIP